MSRFCKTILTQPGNPRTLPAIFSALGTSRFTSAITGLSGGYGIGEALAQIEIPKVEISAGFFYFNVDAGLVLGRENVYGIQGNVCVNLSRRFILITDFGAQFLIFGIDRYEYLFGPRISKRSARVSLFGHAFLGAMTRRDEFLFSSGSELHTGVGMGFGGGVDLNLGRRFALRLLQADFLPGRF